MAMPKNLRALANIESKLADLNEADIMWLLTRIHEEHEKRKDAKAQFASDEPAHNESN